MFHLDVSLGLFYSSHPSHQAALRGILSSYVSHEFVTTRSSSGETGHKFMVPMRSREVCILLTMGYFGGLHTSVDDALGIRGERSHRHRCLGRDGQPSALAWFFPWQ
jgi:hypothetical protein